MKNIPYVMRAENLVVSSVVFNKPEAIALYEVIQDHSDFTTDEDDLQRLAEVEVTLAKLKRAGTFIQVPTRFDPETNLRVDDEYVPFNLRSAYEESVIKQRDHILSVPYQYRLFLALSVKEILGHPWKDALNLFLENFRNPLRKMESKLGGQPFTLPKSQWDRFLIDEQKTFNTLKTYFNIKRLSYEEVSWLLERTATRGMEPDKPQQENELIYHESEEEGAVELITCSPDEIIPDFADVELDPGNKGMLRFEKETAHGTKEGYFSFMVVKQKPGGTVYYPHETGLFKIVQQIFDFPVEISVQFVPQSWEYTVGQVSRARRFTRSKGQSDVNRGKEVGYNTNKQLQDSEALIYDFSEKEYPMFRTQIILCVWGETKSQVMERREKVVETLGDYKIIIPKQIQKQLFYHTLPAVPSKALGHLYNLKLTSQWLAALHPLGGIQLGDQTGYLIGYTGLNDQVPVLNDPLVATRDPLKSATHSSINFGPPGTGKSMLANYMVIEEVKRGGKALIFDPKNERWAWPFEIPYLKGKVNIVTLREGSSDKGKLDPLLRVKDYQEDIKAINSAKRIMWYLTKTSSDTWAGKVIGYGIDMVINPEKRKLIPEGVLTNNQPCMTRVIEVMEGFLNKKIRFEEFPDLDHVTQAAEREVAKALADLRYHANSSLAQLLIGEGNEEPIDYSKHVTILQVRGLQQQSEEDPTNRLRKAVFMGIADVCREFVDAKAEFRTVLFDELYDFTAEPEIASMIRVLLRTGRSMNNKVQLCTHNMRDLVLDNSTDDEDQASEVRSNLGNRFVYRVDDEVEAKKACRFLGITPSSDILELLQNKEIMHSGRFLLRDFKGRVGLVTFRLDEIDPVLYQAFRTDKTANDKREATYGHLRYHHLQEVGV
ncbi:ATP-binding protein [Mechercharimyces sp. CAU 1602]|uniref:ATP-binding protein n=1 Tax=Mechercharimyces sp. CAU 1602 TaxID=2973933 RepID=UPI002161F6B8|nr:ATP-binding protein [Mechercharimyces sp. CAU 1602]MCS1352809.1 ATP-binding protein [Mechercharimyces sp. CAU 1602]